MNKYALVLVTILFFSLYIAFEKNPKYVFIIPTPTVQPRATSNTPGAVDSGQNKPTPTEPPRPTATPAPTPAKQGPYHNGAYTGSVADAYYGNIQVRAIISGGRITDVTFLQYPNDRSTSIEINTQAMPYLKIEAIQAQSANVDIVSGATDSSYAFRESLGSALHKAKN